MSETQLGSEDRNWRSPLLSLSIGIVLSVVFSIMSPLLLVCLIPLQWVYYKTGSRSGLLASLVSMVLMVGVQYVAYRLLFGQFGAAAAFDIALPIALIAGLVVLNLRLKSRTIAPWCKIILVYGVVLAIMAPAADIAFGTPEMRSQFVATASEIFTSLGIGTVDKELLDFSLELSLRFVPLLICVMVLFNWYAATWFWRRRRFQWSGSSALANFRIAEYMVWPLLFGLAAFAASQVVKLPLQVERLAVFLSLGMVFLYFLQGLGIIAAFLQRRRNPESRPLSLLLVCAILFMTPVVNMIAVVVIPLLGVLELWVRMRPATHMQ